MIADILTLARDLFSMRETLCSARQDRRDRLAAYLEQIAACLNDALVDLRNGGNAARACAQLHQYVDLIPSTLDQVLGTEKTSLLRENLRRALMVRFLQVQGANELDSLLERLDEAAGTFIALAGYLRAGA
jgi:hypothetical protein